MRLNVTELLSSSIWPLAIYLLSCEARSADWKPRTFQGRILGGKGRDGWMGEAKGNRRNSGRKGQAKLSLRITYVVDNARIRKRIGISADNYKWSLRKGYRRRARTEWCMRPTSPQRKTAAFSYIKYWQRILYRQSPKNIDIFNRRNNGAKN